MKKLNSFVLVVVVMLCGIAIADETNRFEVYSGMYVGGDALPVGGYHMIREGKTDVIFYLYENIDKYYSGNKDDIIDWGLLNNDRYINLKEGYVLYLSVRDTPRNEKEMSRVFLSPINFTVIVN